jgi:hypothetical protein
MSELLAALRNFTRVPAKVVLVSKTNLSTLVTLVLQPPNEKVFQNALGCLRNFTKVPEYERHIKQVGGHDIVLALGSDGTNKFNFKK